MTKFCVVYGTWTTTANFFCISIWNQSRRCIFSLSTFLEPLSYRTHLHNREFRLVNMNSFFTRRSSRRRSRRYLRSLLLLLLLLLLLSVAVIIAILLFSVLSSLSPVPACSWRVQCLFCCTPQTVQDSSASRELSSLWCQSQHFPLMAWTCEDTLSFLYSKADNKKRKIKKLIVKQGKK